MGKKARKEEASDPIPDEINEIIRRALQREPMPRKDMPKKRASGKPKKK